ncbi:MAG: hypothetical protein FJ240_12720 [Nitrospira sp.]|nr:hypothetical protein [Nitrospira sp.]
MKYIFRKVSLIILALTLFIGSPDVTTSLSFAFEKPLRTESAEVSAINGFLTLILYGARFLDDIETVVIFDIEGDQYYFEPFAPDFDYKIKRGMQAKEALAEVQKFVSFHHAFWRSQLSRILDPNGNIIGYELRPLYNNFVYGRSDVMDVYYWLKEGGKIKVTIRLVPEIERAIRSPGGDGWGGRDGGS